MKLKQLPIIITLLAAGISCVTSIRQGLEFTDFLFRLALVALCFYIFGSILVVVITRLFKSMEEEAEDETSETEEQQELEDIKK